ncbi:hypothetical protein AB4Y63_11820 [Leifsonia sp. YAF41]|uniref:hypothetical protein n=1 Tax=Leifsonia sp. YAF41 TaxID=3233086 RepID=UPI003F97FDF3
MSEHSERTDSHSADWAQQQSRVQIASLISARTGMLVATAVLSAVAYWILGNASRVTCPGGVNADGSYLDSAGNPTDVAPVCISLTLQPNSLVFILLAATVIGAVAIARRFATSVQQARWILDGSLLLLIAIVIVCLSTSYQTLFAIPLTDWQPGSPVPIPFLLNVRVEISDLPIPG